MVDVRKPVIVDIADQLNVLFPELLGRVIPVSEIVVDASNKPKFPVGFVALQDIPINMSQRTNKMPVMTETIIIELWFDSKKIRRLDQTETSFWAFYDYEPLLERFVDWTIDYHTTRGYKLTPTKMDLETSELAVMITFTANHIWDFCRPAQEHGTVKVITKTEIACECEHTTWTGD